MKKNFLVTGGAGFIGSNFVKYIQRNSPQTSIYNLDALTYAGSLENLSSLQNPEKYTFINGDICEKELIVDLLRNYNIDTIVHFAAETHVDRSLLGPETFMRTNIMGTFSLLEAAREVWIQEKQFDSGSVRFHHVSTDEVYGTLRPNAPAFTETTSYTPNSPYAASKASSDHLVRAYGTSYGLPFTISNCSNNYGPYQFPEKLIPLMITNALSGKNLPIYGDGQQIRDWLYVEDHCDAIWQIIVKGTPGESYNVGGNNQITNLEIVENICTILDIAFDKPLNSSFKKLISYVKDRSGHDRRYAMDINKIQKELDWKPKCDLKIGLEKTVSWYLDNTNWLNLIAEEKNYQGWININYLKRGEQ